MNNELYRFSEVWNSSFRLYHRPACVQLVTNVDKRRVLRGVEKKLPSSVVSLYMRSSLKLA